jgi:hypothetical protein
MSDHYISFATNSKERSSSLANLTIHRETVKPRVVKSAPPADSMQLKAPLESIAHPKAGPTDGKATSNHDQDCDLPHNFYNNPFHPLNQWHQHRNDPFSHVMRTDARRGQASEDVILSLEEMMSADMDRLQKLDTGPCSFDFVF